MQLNINKRNIALDKDGYLVNLNDWDKETANVLAKQENISLTPAHWEIIALLQEFYREFEISPAMRALVKYTEKKLGHEKGRSIYLLQLFPPSPAKIASKIAGLPRPTNCL
ncbi:MAG TPA: sulfurtransferase TusE [Cellvibrio sp.]|uniref:TusE/DsrC/DsvC family sulfur relay protein n=1 Tax=Cellvibrio sp. TaxID=1965322 RepID=UPI000EC0A1BB|nr:TusE/DsrC/DsvC family sulfur relay protein [Cellvibrio sp.]HCS63447.1 sulfurtransferase TusE [Cellvibrio sp.]